MAVTIPIRRIAAANGSGGTLPLHILPEKTGSLWPHGEGEGYFAPQKHIKEVSVALMLPESTDTEFRAALARMTGGLSPATLALAFADWWLHLASQPTKQQLMALDAADKAVKLAAYVYCRALHQNSHPCMEVEEEDDRFKGAAWDTFPFALYAQSFLLAQNWWQKAAADIEGINPHHEDMVRFTIRQWLDMAAPTNFPWTDPKVMQKTLETGGANFVKGAWNFLEDLRRYYNRELPRGTENFKVGKDVAVTEGKVVYRNRLIELIQYTPKTGKVYPEPVLIIPAWIMKYYILDLSPHNSMVKHLVESGHTVFMVSWKNPGKEDALLGMDDYLQYGIMDAIDAVTAIVPGQKVHATGYCIGGTLLSIAAAYLARLQDDRLKTLTFFTTQVDFEEAGELLLFVDESELAYLEDLMRKQGYLEKEQVSGAFNMLRSKDLIWSQIVEQYMLGEDKEMFDLMAWNADATRLPCRVHSEYLRSLYLNNDLAENRYKVRGETMYLQDIKVPAFAVATQKDHIAPWKSAYRIHGLMTTEVTFLLTSGGHNAGVISEPGHKGRQYQVRTRQAGDSHIAPDTWRTMVESQEGSWWPVWQRWLADHSGAKTAPPSAGAPGKGYKVLGDAPGTYVYEL